MCLELSLVGDRAQKNVSFPFHPSPLQHIWPWILYLQVTFFHSQGPFFPLFTCSELGCEILKVLHPKPILLRAPRTHPVPRNHLSPPATPVQALPGHECSLMGSSGSQVRSVAKGWRVCFSYLVIWVAESPPTICDVRKFWWRTQESSSCCSGVSVKLVRKT